MKIALPAICFAALVAIPSLAVGKPLQKRVKLRDAMSNKEALCLIWKLLCPTPKPTKARAPECRHPRPIGVKNFMNTDFVGTSVWGRSKASLVLKPFPSPFSERYVPYAPWNARIDEEMSGWSPVHWGNLKNEYLQINLKDRLYLVTGVGIEGAYRAHNSDPIEILNEFEIASGDRKDGIYKKQPRHFTRSKQLKNEPNKEDKIKFEKPFKARYIRIYPISAIGRKPSVRLEVYGCPLGK